ncbi:NAD(P)/FAD-dependent oxidoreductase [soil metagenome]
MMTTEPTKRFDLVVIGTGSGGSAPARKCAAAGWSVAIVDEQPYGGTCALRGCDPKKVLVGAADLLDWQRRMTGWGISGQAAIDWPALMRFKRTFVADVPAQRRESLAQAGIATYDGIARFVSEDLLVVGGRQLQADRFVIASGAKPKRLGISGEELLYDSTRFLELESLPPRIAMVGAGYIGFEFAHVAQRAGAGVTLLGRGQPLRQFEPEHVRALVENTRAIGVDLRLSAEVDSIEPRGDGVRVHFTSPTGADYVDVDLAVHSGGRAPATDTLDLAAANVAADEDGAIRVNEFMRSVSNPRVYAAGDVALRQGSLPLTPVAAHEAHVVAANLLRGNSKTPDYSGIASVVFTVPPLAGVGLTESAARAADMDVTVKSGDTSGWYSSRRVRAGTGAFKTITDKGSGQVVGAHLFGHNAEETINIFALAIRAGLTAEQLRHSIFGYPTSASDITYMV